ncbi:MULTISPECIES: pilus assembly protein TadG-related protein [unclassified Streptomyces]|uniref:pilus assembly protein TadG-related protein n=1 Tax=unclassified Streptomyces TaxID=2593676 RepID=UPI000563E5D8|nr:pilus assembly protein TadG-related protein [Streptomyces sp. NRRL F-2747]
MISAKFDERGQAFPIYIVLVAGMLFAALAFFVFGQAALTRSNAQGAADAAALAAAREARDHLVPGLDFAKFEPDDWKRILRGEFLDSTGACAAASSFAAKNDASATCTPRTREFAVEVTTNGTVGKSVVPGTDSVHGQAKATAAIEPRCTLDAVPAPGPTPSPTAAPGSTPALPVTFNCKGGKALVLDPSKPDPWRKIARALFDVRLVD